MEATEYPCNRVKTCSICGETKNQMLYFARNYKFGKLCQRDQRIKKRGYPIQKKQQRVWYSGM